MKRTCRVQNTIKYIKYKKSKNRIKFKKQNKNKIYKVAAEFFFCCPSIEEQGAYSLKSSLLPTETSLEKTKLSFATWDRFWGRYESMCPLLFEPLNPLWCRLVQALCILPKCLRVQTSVDPPVDLAAVFPWCSPPPLISG